MCARVCVCVVWYVCVWGVGVGVCVGGGVNASVCVCRMRGICVWVCVWCVCKNGKEVCEWGTCIQYMNCSPREQVLYANTAV